MSRASCPRPVRRPPSGASIQSFRVPRPLPEFGVCSAGLTTQAHQRRLDVRNDSAFSRDQRRRGDVAVPPTATSTPRGVGSQWDTHAQEQVWGRRSKSGVNASLVAEVLSTPYVLGDGRLAITSPAGHSVFPTMEVKLFVVVGQKWPFWLPEEQRNGDRAHGSPWTPSTPSVVSPATEKLAQLALDPTGLGLT